MHQVTRAHPWNSIPPGRVAVALLACLTIPACDKKNNYAPPPPPQVTVSTPTEGPVSAFLEFTGNAQAIKTVQLRARVEGYLEKILFKEGDLVNAGQLLFLIQQNTYEAQLKQAEAQVLRDKAELLHAETEFTRFSGLFRQNAAAQTDVDRWRYQRDASRASVMAAEAQVDLAKLNLSYTRVTAPFRGRVSRRYKDPGNLVGGAEQTVLAEINQIDPIYAYFTISEQDLLRVRQEKQRTTTRDDHVPPTPVSLGLANEQGYPHQGHVDYAGIRVDSTTGTLQLRAVFANPDYTILPGLFVRIRAEAGPARASLLIPEDAIGYDQGGSYVLVVDGQNIAQRRGIVLGPKSGTTFAVNSGLAATDRIIVNGVMRAIPGRPVTPVDANAAKAPVGERTGR
ncbi:MAG: efflux RND transporter periplasmic adaptor subunit [Methylotetracoccus sp.]